MKSFLKKTVRWYLYFLAKHRLKKINPTVIGITGSIGKTTTKEAIATVLSEKFCVYQSKKSFNTDIGMLLAILDLPSGFSSPISWIFILARAAWNAFIQRAHYDFFVLEYGADRPGDIDALLKITQPHIGIITGIAPVHIGEKQFKNTDAVFNEKKKLIASLREKDFAIVNGDDHLLQQISPLICNKHTYGFETNNEIFADNIDEDLHGTTAVIHYKNKKFTVKLSVLGAQHVLAVLPAIVIALHYKMELVRIQKALEKFSLPPGRMNKIAGINGSTLIDSSYNASLKTVEGALRLLKHLPARRRIAVLGSMNELGALSESAHRQLGNIVPNTCDILVTVGKSAQFIAEETLKNGFPEGKMKSFDTAETAGQYLEAHLKKGDLVLFKGSQNDVRLERAIKMVMARPQDAHRLLCRQEAGWLKIL